MLNHIDLVMQITIVGFIFLNIYTIFIFSLMFYTLYCILVMIHEPAVLIEGVLFRARYLGSTQLACEGQPTKSTRMMQAEEAVSRIKVIYLIHFYL